MKKIISTRDFADIKRMAQIVNPKVSRKTTLLKQKAKIDAEIAELNGLSLCLRVVLSASSLVLVLSSL